MTSRGGPPTLKNKATKPESPNTRWRSRTLWRGPLGRPWTRTPTALTVITGKTQVAKQRFAESSAVFQAEGGIRDTSVTGVQTCALPISYKGGSPDIESSATRVDKFADELRTKWKVRFFTSIPEMCQHVGAVLLESVDGRVHLAQARAVIAAHKPLFIDKPLASTLEDAREIA